jgi:hypothetical protein
MLLEYTTRLKSPKPVEVPSGPQGWEVRPGEKIGGFLAEGFPDAANLKGALRALDGKGVCINPRIFILKD